MRKVFGGGMRQAGYMAACGVYALKNNIIRLQQDHDNAREIASNLIKTTFTAGLLPVGTGIIILEAYSAHFQELIAQIRGVKGKEGALADLR